MEEKTTPGSRVRAIGILKEVPVPLQSGGLSTRFEIAIEANNLIPLEETFDELKISDEDEQQIIEIDEKPNKPKSDYAVIGYYMYDKKVFDIIRKLKPSARGEYEITDVNNEYIKLKELTYDILEGDWTDAGTFESLNYANKLFFK